MEHGSSQLKGVLLFVPLCGVLGEGAVQCGSCFGCYRYQRHKWEATTRRSKEMQRMLSQRSGVHLTHVFPVLVHSSVQRGKYFLLIEFMGLNHATQSWNLNLNSLFSSQVLPMRPGQRGASIRVTWAFSEYTVFESMSCGRT